MGKMFVTKYPQSLSKDMLRLGEIEMVLDKGNYFQFKTPIHIRSNGLLNDGSVTIDASNGMDLPEYKQLYGGGDNVSVFVSDKYKLTTIHTNGALNIDDIKYSSLITKIDSPYSKIYGDIGSFSRLTGLTYLALNNTSVSGELSSVSGLTGLTYLALSNTSVSGELSSVSGLTGLTYLTLSNTSVSGELSSIKNLSKLNSLNLFKTNVKGTVSDLGVSADVTFISLPTDVTGDLSFAGKYSSLKTLTFKGSSITHTDAQVKELQDRGVTLSIY